MGWTFTSNYHGGGIRAYLDAEFTSENDAGKWEILKSALMYKRTYFAALRWTNKKKNETRILAAVVLVKHVPAAPDGCTLGWKELSEDMGVSEIDCPLAILELLDPPHNDHARQWRRDVRNYHARRKPRPKPGDVVCLVAPLTFTDGSTENRFCVERYKKRGIRFRGLSTRVLYHISNIENRDFTIENAEGSATQSTRSKQGALL